MPQDEFIHAIRSELVARLKRDFSPRTLPDLKDCADAIEGYLCSYLHDMLLRKAPTFIPGSISQDILPEIQINGRNYEPKIGEDVRDSSVLHVALVCRHPGASTKKNPFQRISLSGHGRFRTAGIALPREIRQNHDAIAAVITAIFQTGYSWLAQEVDRVFATPEIAFGAELYRHIRSVVANDELTNNIWMGCGIKEHGMYLLDFGAAMSALSIIGGSGCCVGQSALGLMSEFVGVDVPVDEMFSTIAVREWECKRFDLSTSKYQDHLPRIVRTEAAIYGGDSISIFPIHRSEKDYLVAAFPTRLESELLPSLSANREVLSALFVQSRSKFSKMLRMLRQHSGIDPTGAGIFTGATIASVLKELAKP